MMPSRLFLVATCATLLLASCAGDLDGADEYADLPVSPAIRPANMNAPAPMPGGGPVVVTGENCERAVTLLQMDGVCGGAPCHGTADTPPVLPVADFSGDPALLPAKLKATMGEMACPGEPVLDPNNPAQSLLITKLNDSPPCGVKMPFGGGTIAEEDKICIANWAQAAASTP